MSIQRLSNAGQSGYRYKTLIAGITPVASVPVIGDATALTYSTASVAFTAPGAYAATTFTATSSPGGFTGTSASSPITVSGLSENTAYTFTVTATNASGTSSPSAASNSITTPQAFSPAGAYDALATATVTTATASITFAGIPSGYKHLQIRGIARGSYTATYDRIDYRFNSDSGANYYRHLILGISSGAPGSYGYTSQNLLAAAYVSGASASANVFGPLVLDVLDYSSEIKYKTTKCIGGADNNSTGAYVSMTSGTYASLSPITSITLGPLEQGSNLAVNSSFTLYGVK